MDFNQDQCRKNHTNMSRNYIKINDAGYRWFLPKN